MTTDLLGGLSNEIICNIVNSRWDQASENTRRFDAKVRDWYNLYRCIYTGDPLPFKNVVMLPLLFSACWSDVANKAAISLSGSRIVEMDSMTPEDGPSAKRAEALINQQFLDAKIFEKMIDLLMSGDVYGTGILQYGWRKNVVPYKYRHNVLGVEYEEEVPVTTFDGPDLEVIDILDFKPQPGKKEIDDMLWVTRRYWKDLDDLLEANFMSEQNGEEPEFDRAGLEKLKSMPPTSGVVEEMNERRQVWRSYSQYQALRQERYAKPVELIDMVGLIPAEYAPDGVRLRIMTCANRQIGLRNVSSPFAYCGMRKHFRAYRPMPDMHYFHGTGKVEIGATMAASANKLVSNRLDVLDLVLQPAIFASDTTELDTQNLVLWPGRVIKVHGETGESQIRPMQWDLQAYPMVVNELESISRYIDMGTGVQRDTIQGMLSGDRQTAREFLGRMEQARTRLGLESKLFERTMIEPLANDFRMANRLLLSLPRQISLIGGQAIMDPDTGMMLPPETADVSLNDLNADHRIRAVGASNLLSKTMVRQDLMTAMQAMQSNPIAMQITNWISFFSKFWRGFDFDPHEMIVPGVIPTMNDMAAQMGMTDEQKLGPMGDQLDRLSGNGSPQPSSMLGPLSGMGAGLQQNQGY